MTFDEVEFRAFSQNGEDGILLYIFSLIGTVNKRVVEICAGDGIQCNSANLIINHGWEGLLFDGNEARVDRGQNFYGKCLDTFRLPPRLVHAWITRENVNELIRDNGFFGEIDLLSLDMDGVDYWIWKEIDCIQPRVVVFEYNNRWGPEKSVTVPYHPAFRVKGHDYFGASLGAFVKLGDEKGYRLVGCNRPSTNAFFIRDGIAEEIFTEVSVSACLNHSFAKYQNEKRLPVIENLEWIEV